MSPSRIMAWVVHHLPGGHLPLTPVDVAFRRPIPGTYRGRSLWLIAVIIGLKGFGYITAPSPAMEASLVFPTALHVPIEGWGVVFVVTCLYSAWMSYCHHGRDRYGYNALAGLSFGWAGAYAVGPLFLGAPGYAWQGALSWALTGALVLYLAGYPDPAIDHNAPRCDP